MSQTLRGKLSAAAALLGLLLIAVLAAAGYALVSTIRSTNEALSTYADEVVLAWSLQESYERKLATGRGYLIAQDEEVKREFDRAAADGEVVLAKLHQRVKSPEGIALLAESERLVREHDRALREVMAMNASLDEVARAWTTQVRPKAMHARVAMDAFIAHKERLRAREREHVSRAQERAAWSIGSTVLVALLLVVFGGRRLLRAAERTYAAERDARAAAERERSFFFRLLDQLPFGVVAVDRFATILHVNEVARGMLDDDDLPWATAVTGELPLARALRGDVVTDEQLHSSSDRDYSVTAGPLRDERETIIAAVVAFADISERKRAEKERELFIGALGHDLRNPLQAILMSAEAVLEQDDVPDTTKHTARRIVRSAHRMNDLIRDLLDFARSQHGAIPIKPERCELFEIAADVTAEIKLSQPQRDIRVEHGDGCTGQWDRPRMAQVFQNLIINAVEHGGRDAPITVRTDCDDDLVHARVSNRGSIPHEERRRIFEPFRSRAKSDGLGLGLYIARAIVEAHGGTLAVESDDRDTTFLITLPRHAKLQPAVA